MENIQRLNNFNIDQLRKHWLILREDFIVDILNNMVICNKITGGLSAYKINDDYVFLYSPLTNNVFISNYIYDVFINILLVKSKEIRIILKRLIKEHLKIKTNKIIFNR